MHEILSCEQLCVLCAQPLEVVTLHRDLETKEERIEKTTLDHTEAECLRVLRLYRETYPRSYQGLF